MYNHFRRDFHVSYTAAILPILSILNIAEQPNLDVGSSWQTCNEQQASFIKNYYTPREFWSPKNELNTYMQMN